MWNGHWRRYQQVSQPFSARFLTWGLEAESINPQPRSSELVSLPLPHAMTLAFDDVPDWDAAEDSLNDAQNGQIARMSTPPGNLQVKQVEILDIYEEENLMKTSMQPILPWETMSVSSIRSVTPTRQVRVPKLTCEMLCLA